MLSRLKINVGTDVSSVTRFIFNFTQMKKHHFLLKNLDNLPSVSKEFLNTIENHTIFAFSGDMGAGKTTFILGVLKAMGIEEINGSPTYSLINEYESKDFGNVYHFDVYRLKNSMEALDFGIDEIFESGGYCFIEWPEKIENLLPNNTIWVYLRRNEANECIISFEL